MVFVVQMVKFSGDYCDCHEPKPLKTISYSLNIVRYVTYRIQIPWYCFTITETLAPAARENVSLNGSKAPLFFVSPQPLLHERSLLANIHYSTHVTLAHLHQL